MKYCWRASTCFLFGNFCQKTVKPRVTGEATVELPLDLNTCYLEDENRSSCESNQSSKKFIRRTKLWPIERLVVATAALLQSEGKDCSQRAFIDPKVHDLVYFYN